MEPFAFVGYPPYVEAAIRELRAKVTLANVRSIASLSDSAVLCAQAVASDEKQRDAILEKAAEFKDRLAVACLAIEKMIDDVRHGRNTLGTDPQETMRSNRSSLHRQKT